MTKLKPFYGRRGQTTVNVSFRSRQLVQLLDSSGTLYNLNELELSCYSTRNANLAISSSQVIVGVVVVIP